MSGWVAGSVIVGSLISSNSASDAADTAAQASTQASDASVAEQRRQFDIAYAAQTKAQAQARADQQPFLTAGTGAVNQLAIDLKPGGRFAGTTPFDFRYDQNTDPGYGFRFDQGMRGVNASMAAKGMGISGAGIKGATEFGQGMGSQEYNNAFNRYVTGFNANTGERNQLYNRLAGVAGTGQTTAGQIASQGMNTASNLGSMGANMASNIGNAYMTSAANTGNAAMAASGRKSSYIGDTANVLGRMYGNYGQNPFSANYTPSGYTPAAPYDPYTTEF